VNFYHALKQDFLGSYAIPVTQTTATKHRIVKKRHPLSNILSFSALLFPVITDVKIVEVTNTNLF